MNRKYLLELIKQYVNACIVDSWSGGGHPNDMPLKAEWKEKTKKVLFNYIKKNTKP